MSQVMRANPTHDPSVLFAVMDPKVNRLVRQVRAHGSAQRQPGCRSESSEGRYEQERQRQLPGCGRDACSIVGKRVVMFMGQESEPARSL